MCRIDYADDEGGMWREPPHEATARKDHICGDCGRAIAKGERYTRGVWMMPCEGFTSIAMCGQCVAAGRWLKKICGGHFWPGVMEELVEHWEEEWKLRSFALGRLVAAGRRGWKRRDGELMPLTRVSELVDAALAKVPAEAIHA